MRKPAAVLVALLALATLGPAAPAHAATDPIQPGDYVGSSIGGCTLNFVFVGGGRTYFGTAAHCVKRVGETVRTLANEPFGRVAMIGNPNVTAQDYAFIEVLPAYLYRVSARVLGNGTAPKGVTLASQTRAVDQVRFSGYGVGFDLLKVTREQRVGAIVSDNASEYALIGLDTWGDSGGPIVHTRTKGAYAVVSRLCIGACTSEGPTVQGMLAKATARGLHLTLRTA
ncbi:MAG: hypothetical protein WD770_07835 [Actinomycetota bacterium]